MGEEELAQTYAPYASIEEALDEAAIAVDARVPVREWAGRALAALKDGAPLEQALSQEVSRLPKAATHPPTGLPPRPPVDAALPSSVEKVVRPRKERAEMGELRGRQGEALELLKERGALTSAAVAEALGCNSRNAAHMLMSGLRDKGLATLVDGEWSADGKTAASVVVAKPAKKKSVKKNNARPAQRAPRATRVEAKPSGDRLVVDLRERREKHARAIAAIDNFLAQLGELDAAS